MLKTFPALAAIAAAAALVIPTVGRAQDETSVRVSYADLNLANGIGQRRLQQRIFGAAEIVCGRTDERDLGVRASYMNCRQDALASAQPAFDAAVANALHPSVTVGEAAALVVTAN